MGQPLHLSVQLTILLLSIFQFQISTQQLPIDIYNFSKNKDHVNPFLITLILPCAGVVAVIIIGIGYLLYTLREDQNRKNREQEDLSVQKKCRSTPEGSTQSHGHHLTTFKIETVPHVEQSSCKENDNYERPPVNSNALYDPPPSYSEVVIYNAEDEIL